MKLTLALFFFVLTIQAQVTIGLNEAPIPGALLQLKTVKDEISAGGANATKGLGFPKVKLTKQFDLSDIIKNQEEGDNELHIGLILYQTGFQNNSDGLFCPGVYVWSGKQWDPVFDLSEYDQTYFDPSTGILTDLEGNRYYTRSFGDAGRWMTQNLRSRMVGLCGSLDLSTVDVSTEWAEPRFYYPKGSSGDPSTPPEGWVEQWGLLYNWAAATNRKGGIDGKVLLGDEADKGDAIADVTKQIQGICPRGWHLPSDKEWNDLEEEIGKKPELYTIGGTANQPDWDASWRMFEGARGRVLGTYMKTVNQVLNGEDNSSGDSRSYNEVSGKGFDGLLMGNAERGVFNLFGKYAYFWTSSAVDDTKQDANPGAWMHQLESDIRYPMDKQKVSRIRSERYYLYSVRCKQDGTGKTQ